MLDPVKAGVTRPRIRKEFRSKATRYRPSAEKALSYGTYLTQSLDHLQETVLGCFCAPAAQNVDDPALPIPVPRLPPSSAPTDDESAMEFRSEERSSQLRLVSRPGDQQSDF